MASPKAESPEKSGDSLSNASARKIDTKIEAKKNVKALSDLLRPVRGSLWTGRICAVLAALFGVFPYVAMVNIGNELFTPSLDPARIEWWVKVLIGMFCARLFVYLIGLLVTHIADVRLSASIQGRIIARLGAVPLSWFGENTAGHVRKVLQDDVKNLHILIAHRPVDSLMSICLPIFTLIYVFSIDWRLGVIAFIPVPVYALAYGIMMRGMENKSLELDQRMDAVSATMIEFVKGIQVVKTFGITGKAHKSYARAANEACDFMVEWNQPMVKAASITAALVSTPVIVLAFGASTPWIVGQGWATPVELIVACLVAIALPVTINMVATLAWNYTIGGAAAQRVTSLLALPEQSFGAQQRPEEPVVECRGVTKRYGDTVAVDSLDLTCSPGTVTALIGPSGAGKSTVAKLIARFLDPDSGTIRIGGTELSDMSAEQLYRTVGFVLQDAQLIRATVAENIALGCPDASLEDIQRVARLAHIDEEIMSLPRGYDTVVGEEVSLSGGQAQRIAIARTLLIDAPVLILDEAAAMVDPESEALIQAAVNNLVAGRTVIVIDHRPASVRYADQIVLLDQGRMLACGTHDEIAQHPLYRRLWESSGADVSEISRTPTASGRAAQEGE